MRKARIFLTGMMGSGKSTIGSLLALRFAIPFIDLDSEILRQEGRSIKQIFQAEGEATFREIEKRVFRQVAHRDSFIMATGGGSFIQKTIRDEMLLNGVVVYLEASIRTLAERLADSTSERPKLADGSAVDSTLESLFAARKDIYLQAHHRVNVDEFTPEEIVERIVRILDTE